ncbi:MAG TPA: hypothetical protein PKA98_20525 [Acidimicrobiales bacterium]|nr:hypothetical protein [Acidimicrobiales bacterium]
MSEGTKRRAWPRRLLVLVVLVAVVAVVRDRLITRNERRYGPPAGGSGAGS